MASFTPGPWYTRHGQISSLESEHGCTIASCNRTSRGINDEEVDANAKLISSAPDLLAACERVLRAIDWSVSEDRMSSQEQADLLRSAIAAATGN